MLSLLADLKAAGVASITLDPMAGRVRMIALPDALRARVATHKTDLLALAGDAPLTASPDDLLTLARPPHPMYVPPNTPEGIAQYHQDVAAAIAYAVAVNDPTSWRLVFEQRARIASFPTDDLYLEVSEQISTAKKLASGYTDADRARVWRSGIDLEPIDSAIADYQAGRTPI